MHDTLMTERTRSAATTPAEGRLEQRWIPVTDEHGRTHMESCWITVGQPHPAASAA